MAARPRSFLLLLAALLAACGDRPPQRVLRLGTLIAPPAATEAVDLPAAGTLDGAGLRIPADLNAARIARLELRARGDARLARLSWKLAQDDRFLPYRTLSFPLIPDGRERDYQVDLQREPYWTGRVDTLRLSVEGGTAELLGLAGEPAADLYRSMSLKGESLPALPGLARIALDLPADLPRGAVFESRLGLIPEHDRPGARAVFRAWLGEGNHRDLWWEETVQGGAGGWHPLRKPLPAGSRRLTLEVEATRRGAPLPEGVALWGDPLLVLPGERPGPHLIVVLIDTLRADALGSYGSRLGLTPHLDAFAQRSVRFGQLLAPAPWTLPSVASLLTGLEPQTHGAGLRVGEFAPTGLPGGATTMAEVLRDGGFYTLGIYHNIYVNPAFGLQQGFDEYASVEEPAGALVDRALERLRRYAPDRRLFLYLHLFDPHNPYEPPEPECTLVARRLAPGYRGPLGCAADRRPENPIPPPGDRRWIEALYHAEVAATDRQMGRLLAGLADLDLGRDTVLLVVSDHGEEFWTRIDAERALGYEPNADHGHTHYQELLHVPALLAGPGLEPRVVAEPAGLADLYPTLLRRLGIDPPPSQGRDLLASEPAGRPTVLSDLLLHGAPRWAVRRGPWKLVVPREEGLPLELYHLQDDPGETANLAGREPGVAASLRSWGERELAARAAARRQFLAGDEALGATYLEWNHITKLRALGYLR